MVLNDPIAMNICFILFCAGVFDGVYHGGVVGVDVAFSCA